VIRRELKDQPSPEKFNGHSTDEPVHYHEGMKKWLENLAYHRRKPGSNSAKDSEAVYKDYFPEIAFQLRLLGGTNHQIAVTCGVTPVTINEWARPGSKTFKPAFYEAMMAGGEMADAKVAESMYHKAIGYSHSDEKLFYDREIGVVRAKTTKHYPPDSAAGVFWLTNRQKGRWHNRVSTEVTGVDGQPLSPPTLIIQGMPAPRHPAALERDQQRINGEHKGNGHIPE